MSLLPPIKAVEKHCRPIFPALCVYGAGLVAGLWWHPLSVFPFGGALVLLGGGVCLMFRRRDRLASALFLLAIFLVGALFIGRRLYPDFPDQHIYHYAHNRRLTVEGCIFRPPEFSPEKIRLHVQARHIWIFDKRYPVVGNISLTVRGCEKQFFLNDHIVFSARLRRPQNFKNPGAFNYARWLAFQDIYVTGSLSGDENIAPFGADGGVSLPRQIDEFRNRVRKTIDAQASSPSDHLLRALILGERNMVPDEVRELFDRSGTSHVLAISGLHIGIIAAWAYFLFRRLLNSSETLLLATNVHKLSALLSLVPILFYSLIAGAGISVQRSFLMVGAYILALALDRERDTYNALGIAAFVILILEPSALFQASFQLSFVSVLGMLLLSPPILSLLPQRDKLIQNSEGRLTRAAKRGATLFMVATFSATLAAGPLVAYHFNRVSLSGVAANLLVVPLIGFLTVPLGLLGALASPVPFLSGLLFRGSAHALNIVITLTATFAQIPWTTFLVSTPTKTEVLLCYILLLAICRCLGRRLSPRHLFLPLILVTIACFSPQFFHRPHGLSVTFLDVGQGDAAFVRFPGGKTMLIDGGGSHREGFDTGKNIIAPFLLKNRIKKIDFLVLSHPHPDHYGGLRYIAKHFFVGEFWSNGDAADGPDFGALQAVLEKKNIPVRRLNSLSPRMLIQGVTVAVLHPSPSFSPRTSRDKDGFNNRSLVLRLSYGDRAYLFTGDIDDHGEAFLLSTGADISADILKVPHHGSAASNTEAFLGRASPSIAVCSVGQNNAFGLPAAETIRCYQNHACSVYRTDIHGAITVATDGNEIITRSWRDDEERWRVTNPAR
ncbi:MAG: DNA internalization-related competence protein ComEC/Rec2 [Deltaproteobacteria bacterium]|nr:DNA internalization-related competence protein ComEC/Rec2 [Deltaproteobacteria bacterium]